MASIKKIRTRKPLRIKLKNTESPYLTPTATDDPVLPALFVFQGMRGSGKTFACVQMCRHFEKKGYIQRTFLLCPTAGEKNLNTTIYKNTTIYSNLKTLKQNDVCTAIGSFEKALAQVELRVKADWMEYETYDKHKKAYHKRVTGEKLTPEDINVLEMHQFAPPVREVTPKRHMLILDDCQGTNIYTTARAGMLNHLAIKHRHVPLTVCFLVQSWVGVPRTIRLNATHYCIFRTADKTQLEQIYSCFANNVDQEEFMTLYDEATLHDKHGFLYIDVVPKKPYMRFRQGFDTYLVVERDDGIRTVAAQGEPSLRGKEDDDHDG
jgi:hypothetical protein